MLAAGSPLIDQGLIDPDGLWAVHTRLAAGGDFQERETGLYGMIAVDLTLRAFS